MQGLQQHCRGLTGPSRHPLRASPLSAHHNSVVGQFMCHGSCHRRTGPLKAAAGVQPCWPAPTAAAPATGSHKQCPHVQPASATTHGPSGASSSSSRLHNMVPAAASGAAAAAPVPAGVYWKKIVCLGLIFLCGTINHTLLMSLKDGIIVTTCGAEALPFISAVGVLPATVGFFLFYDKLTNLLKPQQVFFVALLPHLLFYTLFAGYLLPNAAWLHPTQQLGALSAGLPDSLACFVKVIANWSYTLFYIVSELWGGVAISLLFWGMADDLCSVEEAKEVYPRLGILANVGLVAAGSYVKFITRGVAAGNETLGLQLLLATVVGVILIMATVKAYLDKAILPQLGVVGGEAPKKKKKKKDKGKAKGQQGDTWEILKSSLRIRDLTILVMSYGICNKLFGIVWRGQMRATHPTAADFTALMSELAAWTGIITMASMCCSKWVFQLLGWRGAALATPIVVGLAGSTFLVSQLVAGDAGAAATALGGLLLAAGPAAGIVTQVFARASKYSLFDPSKEMVFIAMTDKTEKEKGKAAVDLLGQQVGKSGGSWVLQIALLATGSMAAALPYTTAVYVLVAAAWIRSTMELADDMEGAAGEAVVVATIDETPALVHPTPSSAATLVATQPDGTVVHIALPDYVQDSATQQKEIKASMQSHFD